jgi:hypothetical protein
MKRRIALLAGLLLLLPPREGAAQGLHPALLVGIGTGRWSGPYAEGGKAATTVAAGLDWDVRPRLTVRGELGFASREAKMTVGGIFNEEGALTFTQRYLALLGRFALSPRERGWHSYLEGGIAAYSGGSCDVDLTGGPGFLGGATYSCEEWVPDPFSESRSDIVGVRSGVRPIVGIGATRRRLGATLRLEPMGTLANSGRGAISATTVTLNLEYTFGRKR